MVDAPLRLKTIETTDIKNLLIGGQTGIVGIRFCLAAVTNGENLADPAFSWFLQCKKKNGQGESVGLTPVYENGLVKLSWYRISCLLRYLEECTSSCILP